MIEATYQILSLWSEAPQHLIARDDLATPGLLRGLSKEPLLLRSENEVLARFTSEHGYDFALGQGRAFNDDLSMGFRDKPASWFRFQITRRRSPDRAGCRLVAGQSRADRDRV